MKQIVKYSMLFAVVVALLSLTPSAIAQTNHLSTNLPSVGTLSFHLATFMPPSGDRGCRHDEHRCHAAAPEGGSTALYLLMAGVTCLAAMAFGRRKQNA